MRSILTTAALAGLLAYGSAAFAQEAEAPVDDQADAPPAEAPAAPGDDLNLGEPVGPQVGETFVRETTGDWQIRCVKAPEGRADSCNMYQLLVDGQGNQVAEVNLFRLPAGSRAQAGATIVVPLETLLPQQLTLSVDGGSARQYPYTFCNAAGCVSRVGFTAPEVNQFKAGNSAQLRVVPAAAPDQEVLLTMSLTGFTAAFDSIEAVQ